MTDNDSINIFCLEDYVFTATDTNFMYRIDPYTLETKDKVRTLLKL